MNTLSVILLLLYVAVVCSYAANITNRETFVECGYFRCHNGFCETYSDGNHYCTCYDGWNGHDCTYELSSSHGFCLNKCHHGKCFYHDNDRFTCICQQGWRGATCNDKVSCEGYHCEHGQCHLNSDGHPHCTCDSGWKGQTCNEDNCSKYRCDHGHCSIDLAGEPYCICASRWTGRHCEQAENLSDNCFTLCNHGACKYNSNNNYYRCLCDHGWNGTHCDIRALCGSHPCIHGVCYYQPDGNNFCVCDSWWTGQSCDQALFPRPTTQQVTTTASTTTTTTSTTATKVFTIEPTASTTTMTTTPSTAKPSTFTPASTTPSTSSTTSVPSTATPYHRYQCQKLAVINDIATQTVSSNINASVCTTSGSHSSPEAFVLNHCNNMTTPQSWRQGQQVMAYCNAIPKYTPIATFVNGIYSSNGGISGIFLSCLPTGFKIGVQNCGENPNIEHIEQGGVYIYDPDVYYMIQ